MAVLKVYSRMAMMRMPCFRIIKITEVEDNAKQLPYDSSNNKKCSAPLRDVSALILVSCVYLVVKKDIH